MAKTIKDLDNFLSELKTNILNEFPDLFVKDAVVDVQSDTDFKSSNLVNIIAPDKLELYTDEAGFLKKDIFDDEDIDLECIISHCISIKNLPVIKFILENSNQTVVYSVDFLNESAYSGNLEMVKYFVEKGADINNKYAFYNAIKSENIDMVKYFIDNCSKIIDSCSLEIAVMRNNLPLVQLIVKMCKSFNKYIPVNMENMEIVRFLVDNNIKIDGRNALCQSISSKNIDSVKYLVNLEFDFGEFITDDDNEINRYFFMKCNPEYENKFNPKIVSELKPVKDILY